MSRKAEILAELALSRASFKQDVAAVREELDVSAKVKRSVRFHPFIWLGGAAALGYMLAGPKSRVKTVYKKASGKAKGPAEKQKEVQVAKDIGFFGVLAGIIRFIFPIVRPALIGFLTKNAAGFLSKYAG